MAAPRRKVPFRVLELGCAHGPVRKSLKRRHKLRLEQGQPVEWHGVDFKGLAEFPESDPDCPHLKSTFHEMRNEEFFRDLRRAPDNHFDEVHMHMPGPGAEMLMYLKQIFRVLRPGGIVYAIEQSGTIRGSRVDKNALDAGSQVARLEASIHKTRNDPAKRKSLIASRDKRLKPAIEHNRRIAQAIRDTGFEILVAKTEVDPSFKIYEHAKDAPGIEPEPGKKFPKYPNRRKPWESGALPQRIYGRFSSATEGTHFLVLRKPTKK